MYFGRMIKYDKISFHIDLLLLLVFSLQCNGLKTDYTITENSKCSSQPYLPKCDFNSNTCGWESVSVDAQGLKWSRVESVTSPNGNTLSTDKELGKFMNLAVQKDVKVGSTARLRYKIKKIPPGRAVCISFFVATVKDDDKIPSVILYKREPGGKNIKMADIKEDTKGEWVARAYETCVGESPFILFESTKMSKNAMIAIDNISIMESNMEACPSPVIVAKPEPTTVKVPEETESTTKPEQTEKPEEPENAATSQKDGDDNDDGEGLNEAGKITLIVIGSALGVTFVIVVNVILVKNGVLKCDNKLCKFLGFAAGKKRNDKKKESDKFKDSKMEQVVELVMAQD